MSPETTATLAMLRRATGTILTGNRVKRPTGGRINPCRNFNAPRHGAALVEIVPGRPHRRKQQIGGAKDTPGWKLVTEAVLRGHLPIGSPIKEGQVCKVIKRTGFGGMENLSLTLAENRQPIRIREVGTNLWIITLV